MSDDLLAANMRYQWALKQFEKERERKEELIWALRNVLVLNEFPNGEARHLIRNTASGALIKIGYEGHLKK